MSNHSLDSDDHPDNIRIMHSLGLLHDDDGRFEVFEMWGRLMHDPILSAKADAKRHAIAPPARNEDAAPVFDDLFFAELQNNLHADEGILTSVLKELSPRERLELRERISGVLPLKHP